MGQLPRSQVGGGKTGGNNDLGGVFPDGLVAWDAAGEVGQGLDVGVGAEVVGLQQSGNGIRELFQGIEAVHPHDFHGLVQALEVGVEVEDEELLLFLVPVGADSFEDGGDGSPAHHGDVDGGLVPFNEFAAVPEIFRAGPFRGLRLGLDVGLGSHGNHLVGVNQCRKDI